MQKKLYKSILNYVNLKCGIDSNYKDLTSFFFLNQRVKTERKRIENLVTWFSSFLKLKKITAKPPGLRISNEAATQRRQTKLAYHLNHFEISGISWILGYS